MVEIAMESLEHNAHIEDESAVTTTLMNGGTLETGPDKLDEHLDAKGQSACQKVKKHKITIIISLLLLASVTGNIIQAVIGHYPCTQAQNGSMPVPSLALLGGCPAGWNKNKDSCYFFSDVEKNWDSSRTNCSSYGASLVTLDSEMEMDLVKSKQDDYWIGVRREKADQPWKLPDGSNFTRFEVKGTGFCVYLNGDTVSSTTCDNTRRWTCRKPVHAA